MKPSCATGPRDQSSAHRPYSERDYLSAAYRPHVRCSRSIREPSSVSKLRAIGRIPLPHVDPLPMLLCEVLNTDGLE
jgi:hypothetical protein